jgi:hypothetical protein
MFTGGILRPQAESLFGKYDIQIDQNNSTVSIVEISSGKTLELDLCSFEDVNPSEKLASMFGVGCRAIHLKVREALANPFPEKVVDESLVQGMLELMLNDYKNQYGLQVSSLSKRVYQSSAIEFWEQVPGLIEHRGYYTDNHVLTVAEELKARELIEFNNTQKGFILTKLAITPPEKELTFINKANKFFSEHQFLMALLAIVGLALTIIGLV